MSKYLVKTISVMWAMTLIAGLELFALSKGIDGILLASVIACLAGLAGYEFKAMTEYFKLRKGVSTDAKTD